MAHSISALLERFRNPPPVVMVITGPSGVGKDSVIHAMRAQGKDFVFVVTATDRPKRPGEVDGVDYVFVSTAEFERMIAEDELLEYAFVYHQYKGVPKDQVRKALDAGRDVVMRVDVQGARTIRERLPGVVTVFLAPPDIETLEARLRQRQADTPAQIQARLQAAVEEIALAETFDYVVVNREGQLEQTAQQVFAILQAERLRTRRQRVSL